MVILQSFTPQIQRATYATVQKSNVTSRLLFRLDQKMNSFDLHTTVFTYCIKSYPVAMESCLNINIGSKYCTLIPFQQLLSGFQILVQQSVTHMKADMGNKKLKPSLRLKRFRKWHQGQIKDIQQAFLARKRTNPNLEPHKIKIRNLLETLVCLSKRKESLL